GHLPPAEVLIPADGFNTNNWSVRYPTLGRATPAHRSCARSYHRPLLLILDDATSTLDVATEPKLLFGVFSFLIASVRIMGSRFKRWMKSKLDTSVHSQIYK